MMNVNNQIGITYVDFSPSFFKRAVANYKQGYFKEIIALFEQSEMDSYVGGCIEGRQDGYKRDWRVTEVSQSAKDVAVKDFVESVFMGIDMYDLFDFIHDARLKEFSVIDLTWDIISGKQIITKAEKVNQKYFRRDYKDKKRLKIDWGNRLEEIPPDAALVCESVKIPLLIPVARDFILKEFGIESWASFIETFGEPFIMGRYPAGADETFKSELEAAVNKLAMSSRGIAPEGSSIEIIESRKGTSDHKQFTEKAETGISITLLGHENAVRNSPGLQVGENQAPYKAARAKVVSDITFIEKHIYHLVKMLVDRNFDAVQKYPIFKIDNSEPINVKERLSVIDSAYSKGYKVSADEYAKLGLTKADDQEPFLMRDFNNPADSGF